MDNKFLNPIGRIAKKQNLTSIYNRSIFKNCRDVVFLTDYNYESINFSSRTLKDSQNLNWDFLKNKIELKYLIPMVSLDSDKMDEYKHLMFSIMKGDVIKNNPDDLVSYAEGLEIFERIQNFINLLQNFQNYHLFI